MNVCDSVVVSIMWITAQGRWEVTVCVLHIYKYLFSKACVISGYNITLFAIISQPVKQYSLRFIGDMILFLIIFFCYYFAPNIYYYLFKVRHKFLSSVLEVISVTL